ncbi:acyl-CoA dehydrogenase family protein [Planosporangium sp. 12N6]|uniref:acyl-CoA dehydrogenase family protein n=1 Tax=Planosporangium spinosum TaxID=3402278 RepID=UPI003CEB0548
MILNDVDAGAARDELRDVVEAMFDRISPATGVVHRADAAAAGSIDTELWNRLNQELGAVGLAVPEEWGGTGATIAEVAVLFEAGGRRLSTVPLLGTFLAVEALVRSGDAAACQRWVPDLVSGGTAGAFAWPATRVVAAPVGDSWRLSGTVDLVIDGPTADLLILPAVTGDGLRLFTVPLEGVRRERRETLDLTRQLGLVVLEQTPAQRVDVGSDVVELTEVLRDVAATALACEQLGVAEQALADAVAYAKEREQFGRRIGSFQAVKHLLADLATSADLARSLVEHAVWAATEQPARRRAAAAMAILAASAAACFVSGENVQVHGGIGFSWEHPAHLFFRKARSNAVLLGDRSFYTDRLLAEIGVLKVEGT